MRRKLVCGNWKMYNNVTDSLAFAARLIAELRAAGGIEVAIAPPFTSLYSMGVAFQDTEFKLSSQNLFWEDEGAFTGEISGAFLKDIGCHFAIIGHSERRQYFGETDETVNKRIIAAQRHGLVPIFCVGETLAERESNRTWEVVERQLNGGLKNIDLAKAADFVIAYEPVWAIGTGKTATSAQAQEVHALIRQYLHKKFGAGVAEKVRLLYGGSVKPANSRELMVQPDIDGALVGGASLDVNQFADIVRNAH